MHLLIVAVAVPSFYLSFLLHPSTASPSNEWVTSYVDHRPHLIRPDSNSIALNHLSSIQKLFIDDGWNNITTGCNSHCTISWDENLECWIDTVGYFETVLLGSMRRYVITQANRAIWSLNHNTLTNWNRMAKESIKRLINMPAPEPRDANSFHENKTLSHEIFKWLIDELVEDAKDLTSSITSSSSPYVEAGASSLEPMELDCPLACEHKWELWLYLFMVSSIVTSLLGGSLGVLVFVLDRKETKAVALEEKEYGENAMAVVIIDDVHVVVEKGVGVGVGDNKDTNDAIKQMEHSPPERRSKRVKRSFYTRKQRRLSLAAESSVASAGSSSSTAAAATNNGREVVQMRV